VSQPDEEKVLQDVDAFLRSHRAAYCPKCIGERVGHADVQRILKPRREVAYAFSMGVCSNCGDWTFCVAYVG
jgi:hypothetical protein